MEMMMKGSLVVMDDNLTSTSGEVSASSATRIESTVSAITNIYPHQYSCFTSTNQAPPQKRKRSLPGNPDPDAEVIALSPKTLMATNRFVCEICNKGFQRDQNLQLHRRGHNLPWKLKQRSSKEVVRKKVYVCPEAGCVHHNPARALGDLTGIKKHFSRKHGDKKWKCEKCSKRYAVQSDWKAHSKICGTREYKCDCGTLFSRRDSFITHRAFCDALAEESSKSISVKTEHHHQDHHPFNLHRTAAAAAATTVAAEQLSTIPPWLACHDQAPHEQVLDQYRLSTTTHAHDPVLFSSSTTPLQQGESPVLPSAHMSATALLQKAAQMGVTMSSSSSVSVTTTAGGFPSSRDHGLLSSLKHSNIQAAAGSGSSTGSAGVGGGCDLVELQVIGGASPPNSLLLHDHDVIMSSFTTGLHHSTFHGSLLTQHAGDHHDQSFTRDFLGLKAFPQTSGTAHFGNSNNMSQQLTRFNSSNSSSGGYHVHQNNHHEHINHTLGKDSAWPG